jgi:nitronate monooxygenase
MVSLGLSAQTVPNHRVRLNMAINTRLTETFKLTHPVVLAPMGVAASGRLAAAVAAAGGLGLIGVGYQGQDWIESQTDAAGNVRIGAGFITWRLRMSPELLDVALARRPSAICLSFGDPQPFATQVHAAKVPLICQVQTLSHARRAAEVGATVIVAQGAEAGGHGGSRSVSTLVPEIADFLAKSSPDTLLCAAGGIADGRGLAAALMLGADGVLIGSRLWASEEANVHPNFHAAALAANGDTTIRTRLADIVRNYDWPSDYTARVLRNAFVDTWQGHEAELAASSDIELSKWDKAWDEGHADGANVFISESVGLIRSVAPVATIIEEMVVEAEATIRGVTKKLS